LKYLSPTFPIFVPSRHTAQLWRSAKLITRLHVQGDEQSWIDLGRP
jgi:hypothetical protein